MLDRPRFETLWSRRIGDGAGVVFDELEALYGEPHRKYHAAPAHRALPAPVRSRRRPHGRARRGRDGAVVPRRDLRHSGPGERAAQCGAVRGEGPAGGGRSGFDRTCTGSSWRQPTSTRRRRRSTRRSSSTSISRASAAPGRNSSRTAARCAPSSRMYPMRSSIPGRESSWSRSPRVPCSASPSSSGAGTRRAPGRNIERLCARLETQGRM